MKIINNKTILYATIQGNTEQFLNKILTVSSSVSKRMLCCPCNCHTFQVLYKDEITFNVHFNANNCAANSSTNHSGALCRVKQKL